VVKVCDISTETQSNPTFKCLIFPPKTVGFEILGLWNMYRNQEIQHQTNVLTKISKSVILLNVVRKIILYMFSLKVSNYPKLKRWYPTLIQHVSVQTYTPLNLTNPLYYMSLLRTWYATYSSSKYPRPAPLTHPLYLQFIEIPSSCPPHSPTVLTSVFRCRTEGHLIKK